MPNLRRFAGPVLAGSLLLASSLTTFGQDGSPESVEATPKAQMAAIALDSLSLPGGYTLVGETFLDADGAVTGDLTADDLNGAGFAGQYVSTYSNPDTGAEITSYISDWGSVEGAQAGFELIEDETRTHPDGESEDAEAGVGEAPGETTTGTYPGAEDPAITVSVVDTTFRVDRFLVGTSLSTFDGTPPDAEIVRTLAGTLEGRATSAVGNQAPEGANFTLQASAIPLDGYGRSLQVGFLGPQEAESLYGLQGSSLSQLTSTWNDVVSVGPEATSAPYVALGVTEFGTAEDVTTVVEQAPELTPSTLQVEIVDDVTVDGADAVVGLQYASPATGATEADSFRIMAASGTTLVVVDIQGVSDVAVAREAATTLATAQIGCVGAPSCEAPDLPEGLGA